MPVKASGVDDIAVTVVVPTRNEEKNLPACLATLAGFQEIVVVDSGSTDGTRKIAQGAGATLIDFEWKGGFPKKRNWMLINYRFRTPWVLFLDADERLTERVRKEIAASLDGSAYVGFWLNYTTHFRGTILKYGIAQRKLALFRAGAGLYEQIDDPGWSTLDMEVHEHPILNGKVGQILAPIDHLDFRGMHHFVRRHNDYSSWEAHRYLALDHKDLTTLTSRQRIKYRYIERWWYPFAYFLLTYVIKLGVLDGRAGFVYAMLKYTYFLQIQEKIVEIRRAEPRTTPIYFIQRGN